MVMEGTPESSAPGKPCPDIRLRRVVDVLLASAGLLLLWPLMLGIAVLIRAGTCGPALFFQTRLGLGARPFTFVKFRTHHVDARERFPDWYAYSFSAAELEQQPFKRADDPRITPQGRWLRKTSLDELPNLWNVLTGDMTLVGPRPEIPEMLPCYTPEFMAVFEVKPGITGAAQVNGRADLPIAEAIRLDVDYLRRQTVISDLHILARTLRAVLAGKGAY